MLRIPPRPASPPHTERARRNGTGAAWLQLAVVPSTRRWCVRTMKSGS